MGNRLFRGVAAIIATPSLAIMLAAVMWGATSTIPRVASATIACGTPIGILSNGGFEDPAGSVGSTPTGWTGGHISSDAHSGSQGLILALDYTSTSQTINVGGLEGLTLTFSVWALGGGTMSIGSSSIDVGWNQPNWGFHSVDYVVQPGDTTIDVTLDGSAIQGNFDDASVTYALPCPETPTPEPTEAPTETVETPEPSATVEVPTETPTEIPTEVPTNTPTEAPTNTPTEIPTNTLTEVPTNTPTETVETPDPSATVEMPTATATESPTTTPTATQTATMTDPTATIPGGTATATVPTISATPTMTPNGAEATATATAPAVSLPNTGTGPTSPGTPMAAVLSGITLLIGLFSLGWTLRRRER